MTTWFITGISRGLGLALAQAALDAGDTVVGTVRGEAPVALQGKTGLTVLTLDMTDGAAIAPCVAKAFAEVGRIDVIVNNAGYGLLGALEMATEEETTRLFEVDVFGPIRVIKAALPHLRAQGSGHIVNITSIAGRAPGAASALYSAAKFALEGLTAALAQELAPTGIRVTAVAPGAFRTDFLTPQSIRRSATEDAAYAESVGRLSAAFDSMNGKQLGDPARAAEAIIALVRDAHPPVHLLLGSDALKRTREKVAVMAEEMARWESVTVGTDFPA